MPEQHAHPSTDALVRGRLRAERVEQGLTLEELASRSGINASTLSRIETGSRRLGLDQLVPISRALGLGIDELLAPPDDDDVLLQPRAERRHGVTYWPLTRQLQPGRPRVFKVAIPATKRAVRTAVHPGREWVYVLSGSLRLVLGDRDLLLQPGQAAEFSTSTPHWLGAHSGQVELLVLFDESGESTHLGRGSAPATRRD